MGIVDRSKHLIGGNNRKSYEYLCRNCESVFESDECMIARVDCPACGSGNVRDHVV